jgi:hypothetical protein
LHWEKVAANDKAERDGYIKKLRAEQTQNHRHAEEEVRRDAREVERNILRETVLET